MGAKAHVFQYPYIYIYVNIYIIATPRDKRKEQKIAGQIARGHEHSDWPKLSPMHPCWRPTPLACALEGDQLKSRPPELTSRAGGYPV
jgi:hypothetical protein